MTIATARNNERDIFHGITVKIDCPARLGKPQLKTALSTRIESHGGRCVERMRKDVSHIVFVKERVDEECMSRADEKRLEKLYETYGDGKKIVSVVWVESCITRGERLAEEAYMVQLMHGRHIVEEEETDEEMDGGNPDAQKRKKKKRLSVLLEPERVGKKKRRQSGRTPRGRPIPRRVEDFDVNLCEFESSRHVADTAGSCDIGTATQAAANVLANLDIPNAEDIPSDVDELDTPLSHRCSQKFENRRESEAGLATQASQIDDCHEAGDGQKDAAKDTRARLHAQGEKRCEKTSIEEMKQPAQRFSLRQLQRRPERPVLLNRNLPAEPIQAEPILKKTIGSAVPIPGVAKVASPWRTPTSGVATPSSDFKFPVHRASNATPFRRNGVPSPWSTLRPWDMKKKSGLSQSNLSNVHESPLQQSARSPPQVESIVPSQATVEVSQEFVVTGVLAMTSVKSSVVELCKNAVSQLVGFSLWQQSARKRSPITHIVVGDDRRTMKTMLAIIHGAYFMKPEWVTASLEAGYWLPEAEYLADVKYQEAAEKSRQTRWAAEAGQGIEPLLSGRNIAIHTKGRKTTSQETYQVVWRILMELGATIVPVSNCDLCIVLDDKIKKRPATLRENAQVVRKDWVFQVCEDFEKIDTLPFEL